MNILNALGDRQVLGTYPFEDLSSWERGIVLLASAYGLPLGDEQRAIFQAHTGREYDPPPGGFPVVVAIMGRQSGKSRLAAAIVDFEAIRATREPDGTELFALLIAQDHRAALRTLFSYASSPFDTQPMLGAEVVARTAETIRLRNGCVIAGYPCRPAAVRGLRARVVVADELAFFRSSEGNPLDVEMLRALRPTLAMTAGKLIILSSPNYAAGALFELHKRHFGNAESSTLVWVGDAVSMNPTLPPDYVARLREEDPESARSEIDAEFRVGVCAFFDADALSACIADWRELPPAAGITYSAFCDPSGGRVDAWVTAVGHSDGDRKIVDCVRTWPAPCDPANAAAESSALLKTYGVHQVQGDRYAGAFPSSAFAAHGIRYETAPMDRSQLYLEMLAAVNSARVVLPNDPKLLRELHGLERRRGPSGRDRVDHIRGSHDDRANACAGVVAMLSKRRPQASYIRRLGL